MRKSRGSPLSRRAGIAGMVNYGLLALLAFVTFFPLYNIVVVSLTGPAKIAAADGLSVIPHDPSFATYLTLLQIPKVMLGLVNSLYITVAGVIINMVLTCLAAYALSRPKLPGKGFFMVFIIITMIFEGGLIPDFLLMKDLHLLNTYLSVILYKAVNAYYLIIMMRFFEEVPLSLIEAGKMDGVSEWRTLVSIVLPVSKAGVATVSLFYCVFHWNEYFRAMIYLTNPDKWPLQVVLRELVVSGDKASFIGALNYLKYDVGAAQVDMKALKAGVIVLAILPILLLYPILLRFFSKGALSGAVKE
ncbi:MAG: carbohydrate ABC transporter permease [Spirochaetes bacterium]|nr:carbohydrate ABC transporter permease [Spirochaetota bacterium]